MAIVRALLWFFYVLLLMLAIVSMALHSVTESRDDRIDNTTTWFGIVGGIVGLFIALMGLAILATKNLHRRPVTTFQQWLNAFAVWWFAIVAGMWILYLNVARSQLRRYEKAAFSIAFVSSVFWTVVTALWHWKSQEEFAVAHK